MLLLYLVRFGFFEGGVVLHFHAIGVVFVLSQKDFCKEKSVIFVSFCSCGNLIVSFSFILWFTCSEGMEGEESLNISSFQVKDGKTLRTALLSFLSTLLFFLLSLEKETPDGCKAKNHKYWVPSFGELHVLSSVKSSTQRQHYLVVLPVFVRI